MTVLCVQAILILCFLCHPHIHFTFTCITVYVRIMYGCASFPSQELGLQPEDNFILKVVQLEELLHVRHSIFVIGNAGTGKSKILRSLNKTYQLMKRKPVWQDLNPKAVTNDELFGYINPATREWKDGMDWNAYVHVHRH